MESTADDGILQCPNRKPAVVLRAGKYSRTNNAFNTLRDLNIEQVLKLRNVSFVCYKSDVEVRGEECEPPDHGAALSC